MSTSGVPAAKYILLDSSAIIDYYVPQAARTPDAARRIKMVLDAVRNHHLDAHLYIPNLVVAEVFCTLARFCYSHWDKGVNKKFAPKKTMDKRRYETACGRFKQDIHNGALLYQYELNRYHILALDLIAPIDKHRQFDRKRKNIKSMGTYDLMICAMAMHLTRIHGKNNMLLVSNDRRMSKILATAAPELNQNTAQKLLLPRLSHKLGFGKWGPNIYPRVLDLSRCSETELREQFGDWPLRTRKQRNIEPKS